MTRLQKIIHEKSKAAGLEDIFITHISMTSEKDDYLFLFKVGMVEDLKKIHIAERVNRYVEIVKDTRLDDVKG